MKKANKEDLIQRISDVDVSIYNIYKNLLDLDIKGKKNSDEYLKNLDYLRLAKEIEDSLYDELDLDYAKAFRWKKRLDFNYEVGNSSAAETRMNGYITNMIYPDVKVERNNIVDLDYLINDIQMIKENLSNEFLQVLVYNYNNLANEKSFSKYKNALLDFMYIIIYSNKALEDQLLSNNFNIDLPPKLNVCAYLEMYGNSSFMVDSVYDEYFYEMATSSCNQIRNSFKSVEDIQNIPILISALTMSMAKKDSLVTNMRSDNVIIQNSYLRAIYDKSKTKFIKL